MRWNDSIEIAYQMVINDYRVYMHWYYRKHGSLRNAMRRVYKWLRIFEKAGFQIEFYGDPLQWI